MKGYITGFKVVKENNGEEGVYRVTIQATVALAQLEKDVRALNIIKAKKQKREQEIQDRIVRERTGVPAGVVTCAGKAAREVAAAEGNAALSVQELVLLTRDIWSIAESIDDVRGLLSQLAARTERGAQAAMASGARHVAALWGEVQAQRRRGAS